MTVDIKAKARIGAAVCSLGVPGFLVVPTASAQPPHLPATFTCPGDSGVHYLPDPEDSNAFYTCKNGTQVNHDQCPSVTRLVLGARPDCLSNPDDNLP